MATNASRSPMKPDLRIPVPPPQLHVRSGNIQSEGPLTPTHAGFISPTATPQGSPSKKQLPPGATELPDIFENAMRLVPTAGNPSKATLQHFSRSSPTSPNKSRAPLAEDTVNDLRASVLHEKRPGLTGTSPSKSGKENSEPNSKFARENLYTNPAAQSRQDIYRPKEQFDSATKSIPRGLPADALEKLAKPSVKRLANVTQLCTSRPIFVADCRN